MEIFFEIPMGTSYNALPSEGGFQSRVATDPLCRFFHIDAGQERVYGPRVPGTISKAGLKNREFGSFEREKSLVIVPLCIGIR